MSAFKAAVAALRARLDAARVPFVIGGAFALAAHGHPRFTDDLDVMLLTKTLEPVHQAFQGTDRYEFINEVTFRDTPSGLFIDLFPVEDDAQREAFDTAATTSIHGADDVKVLSREGLALMLLREATQGDPEKRPLRLRDIETLAPSDGLNWPYLRDWAGKMGYEQAYRDLQAPEKTPLD